MSKNSEYQDPFSLEAIREGLNLEEVKTNKLNLLGPGGCVSGERNGAKVQIEIRQRKHVDESHRRAAEIFEERESWYEGTATVTASYRFGQGPNFKLLREGTFRSWLKRYGYQDIEVGEASLDFKLTIKGKPVDQVKDVVLSQLQPLHVYLEERRGTLPRSDGNEIAASMPISTQTRSESLERVDRLVDLLAGLASCDLVGLETLRKLPDNRESENAGTPRFTVSVPSRVDFEPLLDDGEFVTRASTPLQRELAPFDIPCGEVALLEEACGQHKLSAMLASVGDARVEAVDKLLVLTWSRVISDVDVLMSGAKLLAQIASPESRGAYR